MCHKIRRIMNVSAHWKDSFTWWKRRRCLRSITLQRRLRVFLPSLLPSSFSHFHVFKTLLNFFTFLRLACSIFMNERCWIIKSVTICKPNHACKCHPLCESVKHQSIKPSVVCARQSLFQFSSFVGQVGNFLLQLTVLRLRKSFFAARTHEAESGRRRGLLKVVLLTRAR